MLKKLIENIFKTLHTVGASVYTIQLNEQIPDDVIEEVLEKAGALKVEKFNAVAYKVYLLAGDFYAFKSGVVYELKNHGYSFECKEFFRQ